MEVSPIGLDPAQRVGHPRVVSIDGPEIGHLETRYRGRVTEEEWDDIVGTAAQTLSHCPDPLGAPTQRTGLALGKVQSGKTLSYTALIALAIDNGYRVSVVLSGTKKPLLEQTYARLVHDLDASRQSLTPFRNPPPQDAEVVRSVLHGAGHALIVGLKTRKRVADIATLLGSPELRDYPALIIDDEGDEASLNTQFRRGRRSAIYDSILRLRARLPLHSYLAYTATPQANLLISGIDVLSPDFAVLVEPGSGYCGGAVFFGENASDYIRQIPVHEADPEHAAHITDTLKLAIATFLVGAVIRSARGATSRYSMLVHTANLRMDHATLQTAVRHLLQLWRETLQLPDIDPAAQELLGLAARAYTDLCTTVFNPPAWEVVRSQLLDEVCLTEVWMVNSLPLGRDPIATPFRLRNNVLIGGNMLGRGVTIPGLAVTYMTREAQRDTNADTLEQRARWFGYKQEYLDLCRIFLTSSLIHRYTELLRHEDDFWQALQRNQRQGLPVSAWPRMFRLDMESWQLRPTRPNVASYRQFRGQGWDVQRRVVEDPIVGARNIQVARAFFGRYPCQVCRYGNVEHLVMPDANPLAVISELLAHIETEGTDWEKTYVAEYLARLHLGGQLTAIDCLLMSNGTLRQRKVDQAYTNPMQGHSPHRHPGDPDYYPGDEHIHDGRVQLQVHLLELRGGHGPAPIMTTALALHIPVDPRYDLRTVVRGEQNQ